MGSFQGKWERGSGMKIPSMPTLPICCPLHGIDHCFTLWVLYVKLYGFWCLTCVTKSFVTCPFPLQAPCVMEADPQEPDGAGNSSPRAACLLRPRPLPVPMAPFPLFLPSNQKVTFRCLSLSLSSKTQQTRFFFFPPVSNYPTNTHLSRKHFSFSPAPPPKFSPLQQNSMKNLCFGRKPLSL